MYKNEIFKLLGGPQTFIGQWPEIDVVIMKAETSTSTTNENTLPPPFDREEVHGKVLLVRMDENSEPQDFTLEEYKEMTNETHPRTRSSSNLITRPLSRNISYSSENGL